jgi:7-cyano-7-deazaguanine reductase
MNPMNTPEHSQLGKVSAYIDQYDASLLFPLPRETKRREIGITGSIPFLGADLWTAFELSWLNPKGKPQVALAHITIPCESTHIVESKSFKLYLNSFNNTRFESADAVRERIKCDVSAAIWHGGPVMAGAGVKILLPEAFDREPVHELDGLCIDRLDVECDRYQPAPELLSAALDEKPVQETLMSHLLKSNCLDRPARSAADQLQWPADRPRPGCCSIASFRNHNEFHEQCVERIYMDPGALQAHRRGVRALSRRRLPSPRRSTTRSSCRPMRKRGRSSGSRNIFG